MDIVQRLVPERVLPVDVAAAVLVGRAWVPGHVSGPSPVLVRNGLVIDLSAIAPTVSHLLNSEKLAERLDNARSQPIVGTFDDVLANSFSGGSLSDARFLAPIDLHAIKATGVTFVRSLLERLIEEQAGGDPVRAKATRERIEQLVGGDLRQVRPGSARAIELKSLLVSQGASPHYLEVALGPDAELFTKAQPLAAVGVGADIGVPRGSSWTNSEPEVVLVATSEGLPVGATLGNDMNLRDVEGRSALLLGRAKENHASCAVGPFIRIFDDAFTPDTVRNAEIALRIEDDSGVVLDERSPMSEISRDPLELVEQALGATRAYPDGFVLFLGTAFAPIADRGEPGRGFTHHPGDVVSISTPSLGTLVNRVAHCEDIAPWTFGLGALMQNLGRRGLL